MPQLTDRYWPDRPRPRQPLAIVEYVAIVLWDIVVSNIQVARLVLFRRGDGPALALRHDPARSALARGDRGAGGHHHDDAGHASAPTSRADGRALLVHCLDVDDPDAVVAEIKDRYERRLKEIFE